MYPAKPSEPAGAAPAPFAAAPEPFPAAPATGIPVGGLPAPAPLDGSHQWSTDLCDCFDDFGLCCLTFWCPCVTFGRVAEVVDRGATSCGTSGALYALLAFFTGCPWIYSCTYRAKMRAQFGLPDLPCCDCCVHCCCPACALCQEHRELKARGYDPVLGWDLNAQKAARAAATAMYPPAAQGMGR